MKIPDYNLQSLGKQAGLQIDHFLISLFSYLFQLLAKAFSPEERKEWQTGKCESGLTHVHKSLQY
ncbi:MAG: hypothetical protein R3280_04780 [Marinobacter sp.]|uniref:hypothetical protein n=1 Tax=Marinobacter sp. TaxID=50741 RepID=UPI00299E08AA|nr:hypothetical protein [Marinobacter sp.]MDX1633927.1 hypothetical protein [Marinobacter sp.]